MYKRYTLEMVHVRLWVVREDHFQKVSSEKPSDGSIMLSISLKHVRHHSGGHWPTSVCQVHWGHAIARGPSSSACAHGGPVGHVLTMRATSHVFTM